MKPIALLFGLFTVVLVVVTLAGAVSSTLGALDGPTAAELARQDAEAARYTAEIAALERQQRIAADLLWLDYALAAAWRVIPLVAVVGGLAYVAARGAASARFRAAHVEADARGLLPVVVAQLPAVAPQALGAYHAARQLEAGRENVPHTLSYAPHQSYAPRLDYRTDAGRAALPPPAELLPASVAGPSFGELLSTGRIGRGQPLLLGHDLETGEGVWGDWRDLYSAGLGGKQGSGKSWTAASLISQSLLGGARVVLCDPHAGDEESLATRLEPLAPALELVADEPAAILQAARYAHDEFQRRKELAKARQPYDATPLVLVIDEWTSLLRGELGDKLPPLLAALTTEGRKYGVNALLLAQRWEAAAAGGSDVRNTLTAHYVHRMRGDEARMMTGLRASALPDDTLALQPGQAYLFDTKGNIRRVATPRMTAADLGRVAQLLGGATSASTSVPTSERRAVGFHLPVAEVAREVGRGAPLPGHSNAAQWTAEELRILAALKGGKTPGQVAEEIAGGKGGRAYQEAARTVADVIRRALGG